MALQRKILKRLTYDNLTNYNPEFYVADLRFVGPIFTRLRPDLFVNNRSTTLLIGCCTNCTIEQHSFHEARRTCLILVTPSRLTATLQLTTDFTAMNPNTSKTPHDFLLTGNLSATLKSLVQSSSVRPTMKKHPNLGQNTPLWCFRHFRLVCNRPP